MEVNIKCKKGVYFLFIDNRFLNLAEIICRIFKFLSLPEPTVTSACDGIHSRQSLHDQGLGWDWRIWSIGNPKAITEEIKKEAQALDFHYDIVLEKDHIHTEYDINKRG